MADLNPDSGKFQQLWSVKFQQWGSATARIMEDKKLSVAEVIRIMDEQDRDLTRFSESLESFWKAEAEKNARETKYLLEENAKLCQDCANNEGRDLQLLIGII